jgi:hypothetical protein
MDQKTDLKRPLCLGCKTNPRYFFAWVINLTGYYFAKCKKVVASLARQTIRDGIRHGDPNRRLFLINDQGLPG